MVIRGARANLDRRARNEKIAVSIKMYLYFYFWELFCVNCILLVPSILALFSAAFIQFCVYLLVFVPKT